MAVQMSGFGGLLEAVPDALVGVDESGVIRFVNHQAEVLFGYVGSALVGEPVELLVPEALRRGHEKQREDHAGDRQVRHMGSGLELSGRRQDGTQFPADIALAHLETTDGRLVVAAVRDITHYRVAEAERRRLDRLAAVVESSGEAIIGSNVDDVITSWNPAAEKLYGYSRQEIVGRSSSALIPAHRADELRAGLVEVGAGRALKNLDTTRLRKDGTEVHVSLTVAPILDADGAVLGVSTVAHDPTELEQALRAAQRLAAIVEHSTDAIISTTLDDVIRTWNPAAEKMYGWAAEEILGKPSRLIRPAGRAAEVTHILDTAKAGGHVENFETTRARKDGSQFPASLTVSPIRDTDRGPVTGVSVIARDLTEQRKAAQLSRSMIEANLDSMVSISPAGKIIDANEATVRLTGVPRDRLIGTSFHRYFTEPGRAEAIYQLVFTQGAVEDYPLTLCHRNGHPVLTEVVYNASAYRDSNGNVLGVFAAARDVTKQMQAQRERAEEHANAMDRLAELERLQRLTVGRELRMLELKAENESLRKHGHRDEEEPRGRG